MAQNNPFDQFDTAPQSPGVLTGPPPDPFKTAGDKRDEIRTGIAVQGAGRDARNESRNAQNQNFNQAAKLRDDYNNNPDVKNYHAAIPLLSSGLRTADNGQGDLTLIYAYAKMMDPTTGVREGEMANASSTSPWVESKAQELKNQFDSSGRLPESTRLGLRQEMLKKSKGFRGAYNLQRQRYIADAIAYGLDPARVVGPDAADPFRDDMAKYDKERHVGRFADKPGSGPDEGNAPIDLKPLPDANSVEKPVVGDMSGFKQVASGQMRNEPSPEDKATTDHINQMWLNGASMAEINGYLSAKGYPPSGAPTPEQAKYYRSHGGPFQINRFVPQSERQKAAAGPVGAYAAGTADSLTFGFSDELAGGANAALGGDYTQARDSFQGNKTAMAETHPLANVMGNISGAIMTGPIARAAGLQFAPNATRAAGAAMAANPVATSAGLGALYGAGMDNENRLRGAVLGGVTGGVVGKGAQAISPLISNALAARAANSRPGGVIPNAADVAAAGQAEGVTVNRAMIDPRLENRVSGVDASLAGGPALRRGMNEIEGQIEGRVNALGQGGNVMDNATAGQTYQTAGERYIEQSGKAAGRQYDKAERLAGDAKVTPATSLQAVDDAIARLSETPATNAAEINFLNTIKSDLSNDLSVGALRRMRTSLRKKISGGDLVFGEDEARVLGIMDAAANDIRTGLDAQGKAGAARAFDAADKAYRGRMEFINGTLQKIIGKRNSNLSSEQVANNLGGMLRGRDSEGARAFLAKLAPEEHADFAATIADSLGKNNRGEFSIAHFLTQTGEKKFPLASLKVAFGEDGAKSIQNLRVIAKEVDRVNKMRNTSNTARANDYRSAIFNTVLGLGTGAGTGSATTGLATAVAAGGIKAGRDMLSARMLLNPNITKWIRTAPRTANPAAIDAHIGKLESMVRAGTVGRMDAQAIQEYLRNAIGQSPGRAAAQDETNGRREPPAQ